MPERPVAGADDETLEIREDGAIDATAAARERLATHAGTWRPLAQGGDLLVMTRVRADRRQPRGIQFLGAIDGAESLLSALHFLAMGQESGALYVESENAQRVLYLHRGKLLSARSSRPQDRLGEILIADKLVTREDVESCFRDTAESDLLGRTLLHRGLLNNHQIYGALRRQSQEIFASMMTVERGVYYLVKPLDMTEVPAMLHLDIQELLFEGLRRSDELKHLRSVVPSDDMALVPTKSGAPGDLSEDAARLLECLDGRATLAEWFSALGLETLAGVKAAAELLERGLAAEAKSEPEIEPDERDDAAGERARSIIAPYRDAMQAVLAVVSPETGPGRRNLVSVFVESTETFAELLGGVPIADDGSVDTETLVERATARGGEGLEMLRRCLHELLFFLLFEVGQRGDQELVGRLHREIADILANRSATAA